MTNYGRDVSVVLGPGLTTDTATLAAVSPVEQLMEYDLQRYLVDDILVKVDRAAMSNSLETRAPFLDHTVAEFAFTLPPEMKQRHQGGRVDTKWPLRGVLYRHVPQALLDRPKKGFGVPVGAWLRGPLRDWGASQIERAAQAHDGLLDSAKIRYIWDAHQKGSADYSSQLWAVLVFTAWRDRWMGDAPEGATGAPARTIEPQD